MGGLSLEIVLVIAISVSAAALAFDFLVLRRKLIGYRVLMDTDLAADAGEDVLLKQPLSREGTVIPAPAVALVRLRNIGFTDLFADEVEDLTVTFPGRRTISVDISKAPAEVSETLANGLRISEEKVAIAPVSLHRNEGFDLLAVLSGDARGVEVSGWVRGGRVVRDRQGRSRPAIAAMAVLCLALGGLLVDFVTAGHGTSCTGEIKVLTSSLAESVLRQAAADYRRVCDGAAVTVVVSEDSVKTLRAIGQSGTFVAVGPDWPVDPPVVRAPYLTVLYGLVVNPGVRVPGLTLDQIRRVYAGEVTNWNQVGGPDLPITLVGREAGSASRRDLENKLLGALEPARTSDDCVTRIVAGGPLRCEAVSAAELLSRVAAIPGAIGYADVGGIEKSGARPITIGGNSPDIATVRAHAYPFWGGLSVYTVGVPAQDSPTAAFLRYLYETPSSARAAGFVPCSGLPC